jgi:hypothetical protein
VKQYEFFSFVLDPDGKLHLEMTPAMADYLRSKLGRDASTTPPGVEGTVRLDFSDVSANPALVARVLDPPCRSLAVMSAPFIGQQ